MIHRVRLRRFKRFGDVEFVLPGHVVLAGPNNTGKTTVLQAIAAWSLALDRWKQLNDFHRHGGAYTRAPIARQAFAAVPLRAFDLLWREREYAGSVEIEIQDTTGWTVSMELIADSTEQIYVRPRPAAAPDVVRQANLSAVFVPSMSGLGTEEPLYQRPKVDQLLGQAKPGDVLRNLLVEASRSDPAWARCKFRSAACSASSCCPPMRPALTCWLSTASERTRLGWTSRAPGAGSSRCSCC